MKVLFAISFVLVFTISSFSQQSIYQQWVARYNGSANAFDGGVAVKTDALGNVYVTGTSFNTNTSRDFITIKYSSNGGQLWVRTFNGSVNGGDYSNAMALDNNGNVYVTGRSDNGAPTLSDYTTIKYSSDGTQEWVAYYNGPANGVDEAKSIVVDNSGNVYVTGRCLGVSTGQDIATVKYDANGNQIWVMVYSGPGIQPDIGHSIALDLNNNVYVAGEGVGTNTGMDAILIKYNSDGVQQWVQRYNGTGNGGDVAVQVKTDLNNNAIITGYSDGGTANTGIDFMTIKYNSSGVQQWVKRFNGPGNSGDFATSMVLDQSGNIFVTGGAVGTSGIADSVYVTIKYDANGNQVWTSFYPGPVNSVNVARDIGVDNTGNVYVTGSSNFNGYNHYVTIKYNPDGNQQWLMTYSGMVVGDDYSSALVVDNVTGNIYVTGQSWGINYDIATLKYGPELLGVQTNGNKIPVSYSLYQNYPNPFNPMTTINFSIPASGYVTLSIYDINGNEVAVPVNQNLNANNYTISWNASGYSSGVYFYKLQVNGFTSTKKMMLVK